MEYETLPVGNCPPDGYTSVGGLNFTVYCYKNQPYSDLAQVYASNVEDCLESCATFATTLCGGAVFNIEYEVCWLKLSNITAENLQDQESSLFGIASKTQLEPEPSACNNNTRAVENTQDGLEFIVYCDQDFFGWDMCPDSAPDCRAHTDSLEECLEFCSTTHPLCAGVTWNWNLASGWTNCYPKQIAPNGLASIGSPDNITHSAVARFTNGTDDCSPGAFVAGNNVTFEISCSEQRLGNNITMQHSANASDCVHACADYNQSSKQCVGAVYDAFMTDGYENCYLKSADGTPTPDQPGFLFAALQDNASNETSSDTSSGARSKSSSQAWIAAPVIAGVVVFMLIAAFWRWWWSRRKKISVLSTKSTSQHPSIYNIRRSLERPEPSETAGTELTDYPPFSPLNIMTN